MRQFYEDLEERNFRFIFLYLTRESQIRASPGLKNATFCLQKDACFFLYVTAFIKFLPNIIYLISHKGLTFPASGHSNDFPISTSFLLKTARPFSFGHFRSSNTHSTITQAIIDHITLFFCSLQSHLQAAASLTPSPKSNMIRKLKPTKTQFSPSVLSRNLFPLTDSFTVSINCSSHPLARQGNCLTYIFIQNLLYSAPRPDPEGLLIIYKSFNQQNWQFLDGNVKFWSDLWKTNTAGAEVQELRIMRNH